MKTALLIMALLAPSAALGQGSFDLPACSIPPICPAFRTGNILANGSVTATKFIGDCSQCTGGGGSGVSQIVAGTNITISPPGGTGAVTVNSTGGGSETAFFAGSKTFGYGIPGSSVTINASIAATAALTVNNVGVNSVGASIAGSVTGAIVSGGTTGLSATATTVNGTAFIGIGAGNNVVPIFADFVGVHTSNAPLLYGLDEGNTTRTGDFVNFSANSNGLGTFVGNLMNFEVAGISQFVVTSSGGVQAVAAALQDSNPLDSFIFKVSTPTSANYVLVSTFGYISLGSSGTLVTDGWDWTMKGGIAPLNALGSGNSTGGFLSFTAGRGLGQAAFGAAGGAISMTGGSGGSNDGPGGVVSIAAGASGPTNNGNANGGAVSLTAGNGTNNGGGVSISAGNGANSNGGDVNVSVGSGANFPGSIKLNGGGPGIQTALLYDGHFSYNTGGGDPAEFTITSWGSLYPVNPVNGTPENYVMVVSTGDASNKSKWAFSISTAGYVSVGAFDPKTTPVKFTINGDSLLSFAPTLELERAGIPILSLRSTSTNGRSAIIFSTGSVPTTFDQITGPLGGVFFKPSDPNISLQLNGTDSASPTVRLDEIGGTPEIQLRSDDNNFYTNAAALTVSTSAVTISNAHIEYTGPAPTPEASCGVGATVTGNDNAGRVTMGSGASANCVVDFAKAWTKPPVCFVLNTDEGTLSASVPPTETTFTYTGPHSTGDQIEYSCVGYY